MYQRNLQDNQTVQMPLYPKSMISQKAVHRTSVMSPSLQQDKRLGGLAEHESPEYDRNNEQDERPSPAALRLLNPNQNEQKGPSNPSNGGGLKVKDGSKKAAELKKIPCKFFRNSACSAGSSCPFSHTITSRDSTALERDGSSAGSSKAVCEYFQKGSCKFGGKCALAHIFPGQSMGMDRKNKRAAAAAAAAQKSEDTLRSFQGLNGKEFGRVSHNQENGRSARNSGTFRGDSNFNGGMQDTIQDYWQQGREPSRYQHSHNYIDQSTGSEEMPPRYVHATPAVPMSSQGGFSPPNRYETGALAASPFSPPGQKSVFFSNSYENKGTGHFSRGESGHFFGEQNQSGAASPFRMDNAHVNLHMDDRQGRESFIGDRGRVPSQQASATGLAIPLGTAPIDLNESTHEEDFVPGSLTELLTPRELERRNARQDPSRGGRRVSQSDTNALYPAGELHPAQGHRAYYDAGVNTASVQLETMSGPPALEVEDFMRREWQQRQRRYDEQMVSMPRESQLESNTDRSMRQVDNVRKRDYELPYEADRSAAALLRSPWLVPIPAASEVQTPTRLALLESHLPGRSLPQGLAAGMGRLHLTSNGSPSSSHYRSPGQYQTNESSTMKAFAEAEARSRPSNPSSFNEVRSSAENPWSDSNRQSQSMWRPNITSSAKAPYSLHAATSPGFKDNQEAADHAAHLKNGRNANMSNPTYLQISPSSRQTPSKMLHRGSPLAQRQFVPHAVGESETDHFRMSPILLPDPGSRFMHDRAAHHEHDQLHDDDETQFALDLDSS